MPVYGEGECIYDSEKKCALGGKGVEVNPVFCLTCAVFKLAEAVKTEK